MYDASVYHLSRQEDNDAVFTLYDYQIELILRKVKNTAPGLYNLPAWLFRLCSVKLAEVTAGVINLSFRSGRVPEQWLLLQFLRFHSLCSWQILGLFP